MNHPTPPATRVLVMHATPLLASGAMAALSGHADLAVAMAAPRVGPAEYPAQCDVLVADHATGIAIAGCLRHARRAPAMQVLILTTAQRERDVQAALERGVRGYLLADCTADELVAGVRRVAQGLRFLCAAAAQRIADSLAQETLTARELEVLGLLARGHPNKAIAHALGLAVGTVKAHVKAILDKLDACSRTEAVSIAHHRGLVDEAPGHAPRQRSGVATAARADTPLARQYGG